MILLPALCISIKDYTPSGIPHTTQLKLFVMNMKKKAKKIKAWAVIEEDKILINPLGIMYVFSDDEKMNEYIDKWCLALSTNPKAKKVQVEIKIL